MELNEARQRHAELNEQMLDAQYRYHVLDAPTIDDGLYDAGIRELNSLEEQFPELVSSWEGADGKTYRALDYTRLTAVLVEAVKELADRLEALETRVSAER